MPSECGAAAQRCSSLVFRAGLVFLKLSPTLASDSRVFGLGRSPLKVNGSFWLPSQALPS